MTKRSDTLSLQIVFNPLRGHEELEAQPGYDTEYHLQLVHSALQFERGSELVDPYQVRGLKSGGRVEGLRKASGIDTTLLMYTVEQEI